MEFCYGVEAADPAGRDAGNDGPRGNRRYSSLAPDESGRNTAFEDPSSVLNPLIFIAILLAFTAVLLVLLKYRYKQLIVAIIAVSIFFTFVYIFSSIVTVFTSNEIIAVVLPLVLSGLAIALLYLYPGMVCH